MTLQRTSMSQLRRTAIRGGMKTLREDGWNKIIDGHTTLDEIVRLTQEDGFDVDETA